MARTTHSAGPESLFDPGIYFDPNGRPFELAERSWRGWMNGALRLQNEAIDFWRTAAGKNWAAASDIAGCATAAQAFDAQSKYVQESFADLVGEGQKIAAMCGEIFQENVAMLQAVARGEEPATGGSGT